MREIFKVKTLSLVGFFILKTGCSCAVTHSVAFMTFDYRVVADWFFRSLLQFSVNCIVNCNCLQFLVRFFLTDYSGWTVIYCVLTFHQAVCYDWSCRQYRTWVYTVMSVYYHFEAAVNTLLHVLIALCTLFIFFNDCLWLTRFRSECLTFSFVVVQVPVHSLYYAVSKIQQYQWQHFCKLVHYWDMSYWEHGSTSARNCNIDIIW